MLLISWNINSLRSSEEKFLDYMDRYQPDVMMIQELRATIEDLSFFLRIIPGYSVDFNPSEKAGYSGTALYYKDTLGIEHVGSTRDEILDSEGRSIIATRGNLTLINLYTPNGSSGIERLEFKLTYYSHLKTYIQSLLADGGKVVLGGDLNIAHTPLDLYAPLQNDMHSGFLPSERQALQDILDIGMVDTFRLFHTEPGKYSWWHMSDPTRENNKGWRFDYFLTSTNLIPHIKDAQILRDEFGSDHCPVTLTLDI